MGLLVHDLKSPLGSVLVNVSDRALANRTRPKRVKSSPKVILATQVMHRMVMDMLDVMKVDERGLVPKRQRVDIGSLLHEAAKPAISQARTSGHRIVVETPEQAIAASVDPDLLYAVCWKTCSTMRSRSAAAAR